MRFIYCVDCQDVRRIPKDGMEVRCKCGGVSARTVGAGGEEVVTELYGERPYLLEIPGTDFRAAVDVVESGLHLPDKGPELRCIMHRRNSRNVRRMGRRRTA